MTLRNITIIAAGSRGDIQPYIAIGVALRNAGYQVRIISDRNHALFIESFDLPHACKLGDMDKTMKTNRSVQEAMSEGDAQVFLKYVNESSKLKAPRDCKVFLDEMRQNRPDLLIVGSLCAYFGHFAPKSLHIPTISVKLQALVHDPKRAIWGLPTLPNGGHYASFQNMVGNLYDAMKPYDEAMISLDELGVLSEYTKAQFMKDTESPSHPYIVCQSPMFKPILYPHAHPNISFVGASVLDQAQQQAHNESFGGDEARERIELFLEADAKKRPVYCGWGSMTCKSPEFMVNLAVRSLQLSGQRGIVLGGWANMSLATLQAATSDEELISYAEENVLFVQQAPHENLFPRVACTVHHGGAGTTNAALRSGVPTVVTPVFLDQFCHAHLVSELGVGIGFSKQLQQISPEELAGAILEAVSETNMVVRAWEVSSKMLQEDGAAAVVSEVEHLWEDHAMTENAQSVNKAGSTVASADRNKSPITVVSESKV